MSLYQSLFAKKVVDPEVEKELERNKREALKKLPAIGNAQGISVKEAASRLGVSTSTVYRWIAKGKIKSAFKSQSKAGGRSITWVSGMEIFDLSHQKIQYRESDLH